MPTELLFLRDAYLTEFDATVTAVDDHRVALDRTAFYPTGGGQPHDAGALGGGGGGGRAQGDGDAIWHTLADGDRCPTVGDEVHGDVDWERRHALMRTHTALHVLCGVIWNEWGSPVTGGNMEPLSARMDFEFDPLPEGFGPRDRGAGQRRAGGRPPDRGRASCPAPSRCSTRTSSARRST